MQNELRSKDKDLTSENALEICRRIEASKDHIEKMLQHKTNISSTVDAISHKRLCSKCDKAHPPRNCPAFGSICNNSQGKNHWAKQCRNKNKYKKEENTTSGCSRPRYHTKFSKQKINTKRVYTMKYKDSDTYSQIYMNMISIDSF